MRSRPKLRYLNRYVRRGKLYAYYRRDGHQHRIEGEVGTAAWHKDYARIHEMFEKAGKGSAKPGTFAALVEAYMESPDYQGLKPKTKASYRLELDFLREELGVAKVGTVTLQVMAKMRDKVADTRTPRKAVEVVKAFKVLYRFGREDGLVQENLAKDLRKPRTYKSDPWRPWTAEELEIFFLDARPVWRRAAAILLYTGLRRGDARKLQRMHIGREFIEFTTSKTGREVCIPLHGDLAEELVKPLPVESLYLIAGERGQQLCPDWISHGIRKECKRLGMEDPPPVHGLRKNAVARLKEVGCTDDEIHAITGQSKEMIAHYGKKFDRRRLASAAVVKINQKRNSENDS